MEFAPYLKESVVKLRKDIETFKSAFCISSYDKWYYDQPSGVFEFSKEHETLFFSFQVIGTFSRTSGTWLWAWANSHLYPQVRTASATIRAFGEIHHFDVLTKDTWKAEEADGWEMLSIANDLLHPVGMYRINSEDTPMFIIMTKHLSTEEAEHLKATRKEMVDCGNHGLRRMAFVCQHLDKITPRGFNEAFESEENMELHPDDDFQAWCDECEKVRLLHDGWNEESEKFAKIRLFCEKCYFEMKHFNL